MSQQRHVNVQGPLYLNGSSRCVSVAEPDAERTPTRRSTRRTTDDLRQHIRDHFVRIRESETQAMTKHKHLLLCAVELSSLRLC